MSIEQSNTIGALAGALAAAAPGLREARKDRGNTHLKSKYATLESFLEAVRDPLAAQGVAITQGVSAEAGRVTVTTQLSHASGEWMRTSLSLPIPEALVRRTTATFSATKTTARPSGHRPAGDAMSTRWSERSAKRSTTRAGPARRRPRWPAFGTSA